MVVEREDEGTRPANACGLRVLIARWLSVQLIEDRRGEAFRDGIHVAVVDRGPRDHLTHGRLLRLALKDSRGLDPQDMALLVAIRRAGLHLEHPPGTLGLQ